MKKTKRLWALLLAMVMALGLISTAFAAPTIDSGRKASLSLYKYDITAASEDGAWNTASYVSTGVQDDAVTDKLAQYAIQGVEFTYLRVADIAILPPLPWVMWWIIRSSAHCPLLPLRLPASLPIPLRTR